MVKYDFEDNVTLQEVEVREDSTTGYQLESVAADLAIMEDRIREFKTLQERYDLEKKRLCKLMENAGVKSWSLPNGTKFTLVEEIPATFVDVTKFDEELFKEHCRDLWEQYQITKKEYKKGRSAYVRITAKKG